VPFSLKIPRSFPVSFNQNLDLDGSDGTDLKGLELRRIQIQKKREDINYSGFIKKTIQNIHERVRGNKLSSKLTKQQSRVAEGTDKSFGIDSKVPSSPKHTISYLEKVDTS
jgi:hypothetical protein